MYSHKSALFQKALAFHRSFFEQLPGQFLRSHLHQSIDQAFFDYFTTLALLLEEPHTSETKGAFVRQKKRLLYSVIAHLNVGLHDGDLTEEQLENFEEELLRFLDRQEQGLLKRKTMVVLTIQAGHGHTSAAKALVAGLCARYGNDFRVVLKEVDVDVNSFYESTVKHTPGVYKWLWQSTDSEEGMGIVNSFAYPMFAKKLDSILEEEDPDLIVSTYSFPGVNYWIKKTLKQHKKTVPYVAVITDSISVHRMWYGEDIDFYIVPNEDTAKSVIKKGYAKSKVKTLGFPVHPRFYTDIDVSAERIKRGLDPTKLTFLASVGTGSTAKDIEYITEFEKACGGDAQLVVILGKNDSLLKKLRKQNLGSSVHLFGWVDDMYKFMKFSDIVVTKAGGATVMECVAAHKPMIIPKVLPGQEQGNAELITTYGLGVILKKRQSVIDVMEDFTKNPNKLTKLKKDFAKAAVEKGTYRIAEFLAGLVKK